MGLSLNIPQDAENTLRQAFGADLDRAALEALVIQGYRSRRLGLQEVQRALNLQTRFDAEQWLGDRGVPLDYTAEDFEQDMAAIRKLRSGRTP